MQLVKSEIYKWLNKYLVIGQAPPQMVRRPFNDTSHCSHGQGNTWSSVVDRKGAHGCASPLGCSCSLLCEQILFSRLIYRHATISEQPVRSIPVLAFRKEYV